VTLSLNYNRVTFERVRVIAFILLSCPFVILSIATHEAWRYDDAERGGYEDPKNECDCPAERV